MERFALSFILVFSAVFGQVVPGQSVTVDRVVGVVNGDAITLSMVEDMMNAIWIDPQDMPRSRRAALQRLIDHKLKLQEARRLGADVIAELITSEERLLQELAKVASRFASPEEIPRVLRQRGMTQADLEEYLLEEIMIQDMVNRKFRLFVEVTDIEAADFFEQHREEFVIQIFFRLAPNADKAAKEAAREKAEEVLKKLKNGASFPTYAKQEGTVDYKTVDELKRIPILAAAVSRLESGEISDLIETPAGYFVIWRPAQLQFDDAKEDIKKRLLQQKTDAELEAWLENQRKQADIRVKVELED